MWIKCTTDTLPEFTKGRPYDTWDTRKLSVPRTLSSGQYCLMDDDARIVDVPMEHFTPCDPPYYKDSHQRNWGSDIVPKDEWVDPTKEYWCGDKRVEHIHIELHNGNGDEVTFPVKGIVVVRERPYKAEFHIWTLDGRSLVAGYQSLSIRRANG